MATGLDPIRDVRDVGPEQYRAGLGEYLSTVMSDAWASGPISELGRVMDTAEAQADALDKGEHLLTPEEANESGRELGLNFDRPVSRGAYDVLAAEKTRENAAQLVFQRARADNGYGTLHWLLGGGAELLTQAADPLNIASAFVPVVGEARYAVWASRIGRAGATLAKGAVEGAAGQALLEPLTRLDQAALDPDYGMLDSLVNVAFGAGLGAGLHGVGAGLHWLGEKWTARQAHGNAPGAPEAAAGGTKEAANLVVERARPSAAEPQRVAEAMDTLRPETREATLRAAIGQLAQDKPVDVEPVLASDPNWARPGGVRDQVEQRPLPAPLPAATPLDPEAHLRDLAVQLRDQFKDQLPSSHIVPADFQPEPATLAEARRIARGWTPEKGIDEPQSLSQFVRSRGGLRVDGLEAQDLRAADLDQLSGLVRTAGKGGQQADLMARAATEAGFYEFDPHGVGNGAVPTNRFLSDLVADAGGRKLFAKTGDFEAWRAQQAYFEQYRQWLHDELQWDPKGRPAREVAYFLSQDVGTQRLMALAERVDRLDEHASLEALDGLDRELARSNRATLDRLEAEASTRLQGWEPELEGPRPTGDSESASLTPQEWENLHAELDRSLGDQGEAGRGPEQADAGGDAPRPGDAAPGRQPADRPAPEAAGLRRQGEGADGTARAPSDVAGSALGDFAERQRTADLGADPAALAARDERLEAEHADISQALADDLARFAPLIDAEARGELDAIAAAFDDEAKAYAALASCQIGGDA